MNHPVLIIVGFALVALVSGIAGYIGWYLSHKSFNEGFTLGFETGFRDCREQLTPKPKNPLRPV